MEKIKIGDKVRLEWTDSASWDGVVVHTPDGPGDSWEVKNERGKIMLVNIYCQEFIGMARLEDGDEDDNIPF